MRTRTALSILVAGTSGLVTLGIGPAQAAPDRPPSPQPPREVSVTVEMDCEGTPKTVTVSARLPRKVAAGRAFAVEAITSDLPAGQAVQLATTNASPATTAAGTGRWQTGTTSQLVAAKRAGQSIEVTVSHASYMDAIDTVGFTRVDCAPTGPATLGRIRIVGHTALPLAPPTSVVGFAGLECYSDLMPGMPVGGGWTRTGFTAPAEVTAGQTFSLSDLTFEGDVNNGLTDLVPVIRAIGAEPSPVDASTPLTVTAPPGGTVELVLDRVEVWFTFQPGNQRRRLGHCEVLESGHLATIPVVAAATAAVSGLRTGPQ